MFILFLKCFFHYIFHNIEIKKDVIALLDKSGIDYEFNGEEQYCTNNTVNVFFKGISSEALMLSTKEYCSISNGSSRGSMGYDFVAISFCFIQSAGGIEKIPDSASA